MTDLKQSEQEVKTMSKQREKFEEWCRGEGSRCFDRHIDFPDMYGDDDISNLWHGYQQGVKDTEAQYAEIHATLMNELHKMAMGKPALPSGYAAIVLNQTKQALAKIKGRE